MSAKVPKVLGEDARGGPRSGDSILDVRGLVSGYGRQNVLHGVDLQLSAGEAVALIGPNGAGKSTTSKCLVAVHPIWAGRASYGPVDITASSPRILLREGLRLVPQEGGTFARLSVQQNFDLSARLLPSEERTAAIQDALTLFPDLKDRLRQRAGALSGGQQQMLAVGMALAGRPRVLVLDEPSLGLAPNLFARVLAAIDEERRRRGLSVLLIEQNVEIAVPHVDRVMVMSQGQVVHEASAADLRIGELWEFF